MQRMPGICEYISRHCSIAGFEGSNHFAPGFKVKHLKQPVASENALVFLYQQISNTFLL